MTTTVHDLALDRITDWVDPVEILTLPKKRTPTTTPMAPTATDTLHTFHLPHPQDQPGAAKTTVAQIGEPPLAAAAKKPRQVTGPTLDELDEAADAMAALVAKYVGRVAGHAARQLGGITTTASGLHDFAITAQADPASRQAAVSADDIGVITDQWAVVVGQVLAPAVAADYVAGWQRQQARIAAIIQEANLTEEQLAQFQLPLIDVQEAAQMAAADAANRLVGIGDELWGHARTSLTEGMAKGESVPKLAERVRQATGVALPRATVIARTESMNARNAGAYDEMTTLVGLGIVESKTWLATHDARTRPTHVAADGQTVPFDAKFMVGGWPADRPHDPALPAEEAVSCRCSLIWNLSGEEPMYPLASALLDFHLPGKHNQKDHGRSFGDRAAAAAKGDAALKAVAYEPSSGRIRAALDEYGGEGSDSYQGINDGLRGGSAYGHTELSDRSRANVAALDDAMREAPGAPTDLVVYRTVRHDAFGLTNDQYYQPEARDMTGLEWRDKAFVSTGTGRQWQVDTQQIAMRVVVPKGTKAISYSTRDVDGGGLDRDEVLLDRGLTFRVVADHGFRRTDSAGRPDPYSGRDIDVEVVP